jgi:ArsR family transcriptional regulator, arsenate/arsenite/antimonite-responsive transcriptional repressor
MYGWSRMAGLITKERAKAVCVFRALSDETRLEILERLREGERCVCDLMDALDAAQSRLSFHLKVLKDAGLIQDRPEGRWIYYSLKPDAIEETGALLEAIRTPFKSHRGGSRCC